MKYVITLVCIFNYFLTDAIGQTNLFAKSFLKNNFYGSTERNTFDNRGKNSTLLQGSLFGGDDGTASSFAGGGIYFYRRNYKTFSFIPGAGIMYLQYSEIDATTYHAVGAEISGALNLQIAKYFFLRGTGRVGLHSARDPILGGAILGTGISVWRLETSVDLGLHRCFGNMYYSGRFNIGYAFNGSKKISPF